MPKSNANAQHVYENASQKWIEMAKQTLPASFRPTCKQWVVVLNLLKQYGSTSRVSLSISLIFGVTAATPADHGDSIMSRE